MFVHDVKYAGLTVQQKWAKIAERLAPKKVDALLISTLDDIDWIVNMRGNDIKYNPVFFSYAIFFPAYGEGAHSTLSLFIQGSKVSDESVQAHLKDNKISVYEYSEITHHLKSLAEEKKKIGYDENNCN